MAKVENSVWLNQHLQTLLSIVDRMGNDGSYAEYSHHTALKLIAVRYYADIFLKVVKKQMENNMCGGAVYVDLFAGSGLVKIKGAVSGDFLPGSALCATTLKRQFDYTVCVEKDPDRCASLKSHLGKVIEPDNFDIINGDCNSTIQHVVDLIGRKVDNPIIFAFVDPEGIEIKHPTLKALNDRFPRCDFIVNVNTRGLKRAIGKYASGDNVIKVPIQEYMGNSIDSIMSEMESGGTPEKQYAKLLRYAFEKSNGETIKIRENGERIAYHLLGYTRETKGGSVYMRGYKELKPRLESLDGNHVRKEMDKLRGRQSSLDPHLG